MKYKIKRADRASNPCFVGEIVWDFWGCDFGCARENTILFGIDYISVTRNENHSNPFFTIPIEDLETV